MVCVNVCVIENAYVQLVVMAPRMDGRGRGRGAAQPHVDEPLVEDFVEEVDVEEPAPPVVPTPLGGDAQVPPPPLGLDAAGLTQILRAA